MRARLAAAGRGSTPKETVIRSTYRTDYVDFGFEFDISGGTTWPYSGEFWHSWDGQAGEITVSIWGGVRSAGIEIKVNGNTVFYDGDCYSGDPHRW